MQIIPASMAWESNCAVRLHTGSIGVDALWESEVYICIVYFVDDFFAGVVLHSILQSVAASWGFCGGEYSWDCY